MNTRGLVKTKSVSGKKVNILGINVPILLIILISAFAAVTVFTAVEQAAKGAELVYLENRGDQIASDNQDLSSKLIMDSSLSKVADQASASGMIKPDKIVYLASQPETAAKLP